MIFPSRDFVNPDEFVDNLCSTLMTETEQNLLTMKAIELNIIQYQPYLNLLSIIPLHQLFDLLVYVEKPVQIINTAYRLLGLPDLEHQYRYQPLYCDTLLRLLNAKDELTLKAHCRTLEDLGLGYVLARGHLQDVLFGVLSQSKQSLSGRTIQKAFEVQVSSVMINQLSHQPVEWNIGSTSIGENQVVDGVIFAKNRSIVVFRINFFTTTDARMTNMLRECGQLQLKLSQLGIVLVWIIDGRGIYQMRNLLKRIYVKLPNIYNLAQLTDHFGDEIPIIYGSI